MCGIAGFHIKNPKLKVKSNDGIEAMVDKLLLGIEDRGKHATGFVAVSREGEVVLDKAAVTATEFIKDRSKLPVGVQTALLHTRYHTKGKPEIIGNNHPVLYKSCFTIHNGDIKNDDDLFREFNLKRNFEVDTEIIPALIDKFGMGDMEHVKEALTKFRGPMAIATIDPVNHKGKLLLAKGLASPLVLFENDNFIMWASVEKAMREAWGTVFGTPPRHDKFRYLREGDIVYIDGKNVITDTFDVPASRSFDHGHRGHEPAWQRTQRDNAWANRRRERASIPRTTSASGSGTGGNGIALLWGTTEALFLTEQSFIESVKNYRKEGGNARIWSKRESYESKDFSDVEKGEPFAWVSCRCGESVFMRDMRQHLKYGVVCVDCYVVIRKAYEHKVGVSAELAEAASSGKPIHSLGGRGSEDEPKVRELLPQDKKNLEKWASLEAEAHFLTLQRVAETAGLTLEAVDFLVFRTGAQAADFGGNMTDLKSQLTALYYEYEPAVWEDFWDQINAKVLGESEQEEEVQYTSYTVRKAAGVSEVWYTCSQHGESFRSGDSCPTCDHAEEIAGEIEREASQCDECGLYFPQYQLRHHAKENFYLCGDCSKYFADPCRTEDKPEEGGVLIDLLRCPKCQTFISKKYPCKVCAVKETAEPKPVSLEKLTTIDPKTAGPCKGFGEGSNKKCGKHVKFCVGTMFAYCNRHFTTCSHPRCNKEANTVLVDGSRTCHGHARGQQGSQADTALQKSGVVYMEVR